MSRLLFAAARGARIEFFATTSHLEYNWQVIERVPLKKQDFYRIHPDDEHLQYGPISTALREMAEDDAWRSTWEWFLARAAADEFTEFFDSRQGEPDYPLFYLILAEALADSGL